MVSEPDDTVEQGAKARSNIAWYMPKALTTKLLFIFAQIEHIQADNDGQQAQAPQGTAAQERLEASEWPFTNRDGRKP
jgi:hypothetical protein